MTEKKPMTYNETTQYLFNCYPVFEHVGGSAYKEGLSNSLALDQHFGHPHKAYKTIHIAGTNGKGSCSHTIASILQKAGLRVGLYTSPHLIDFRERIRVNGLPISEQRVIDFVEKDRHFFEPLHPSFFELTTALALLYFKEQQVDIAVIEVGLGGRLDCTNIITPVLSVITNIGFDHMQFLGNTLPQIASEKAGIIKEGVPVVIGEALAETRPVFEQTANTQHAPIVFAEDQPEIIESSMTPNGLKYKTRNFGWIEGELGGNYQVKNTNTILHAVEALRRIEGESEWTSAITTDVVKEGFADVCRSTGLMGRWQKLNDHPKVICDTGHNKEAWEYLSPQIKAQSCDQLRMVFGMVDDKDIEAVMALLPKNAVYYWTQAQSKRAIPASDVMKIGKKHGLEGKSYNNVEDALHDALADCQPNDFVFIGGSSYIVADLLLLSIF